MFFDFLRAVNLIAFSDTTGGRSSFSIELTC